MLCSTNAAAAAVITCRSIAAFWCRDTRFLPHGTRLEMSFYQISTRHSCRMGILNRIHSLHMIHLNHIRISNAKHFQPIWGRKIFHPQGDKPNAQTVSTYDTLQSRNLSTQKPITIFVRQSFLASTLRIVTSASSPQPYSERFLQRIISFWLLASPK